VTGTAVIGTAAIGTAMIGTVGDLVEDIAVRLDGPVNLASDTPAIIRRRRGGSAANMAVSVARHGGAARFIGQIGDDAIGEVMVAALRAEGVDVVVRRGGRTGTIVVLVDAAGERTMLTDRGACADLDDPDPAWLDGLRALHVPMYSFTGGALADTAATLVAWAHERSVVVSVDLSSVALIESMGAAAMRALLDRLRPDVVLANELEAAAFGGLDAMAAVADIAVVKQGARPALVHRRVEVDGGAVWVEVAVPTVPVVRDTTGAGDAFAAGFLGALLAGVEPTEAARAGHRAAAAAIAAVSSLDP
jgi:sugar/nucleoside kinase (ribokinase family)